MISAPRETRNRLLAAQFLDRAGEPRAVGVGEIELIPADQVSTWPLQTKDQPHAQPEPLEKSCSADHVLMNNPRVFDALGAELLETAEAAVVGRTHFASDESIEAKARSH
jgi:hypothetical protein